MLTWPDAVTCAQLARTVPEFPGAIGAIDASAIEVMDLRVPGLKLVRKDKKWPAVSLTVVVDWFGRPLGFRTSPGATNDQKAWTGLLSRLYEVYGAPFGDQFYLLADGGYFGQEVLRPLVDGDPAQMHSFRRALIEHFFARLKQAFGILHQVPARTWQGAQEIVAAAVLLITIDLQWYPLRHSRHYLPRIPR